MRDYLSQIDPASGLPACRLDASGQPIPVQVHDAALGIIALAAAGQHDRADGLMRAVLTWRDGDGRVQPILGTTHPEALHATAFARFRGHVSAILAASCTVSGIPDDLLDWAQRVCTNGPVVYASSVQWGTFRFGDGTLLGQTLGDGILLLRETGALGLALFNEGMRRGRADLIAAAHQAALHIAAAFRSDFTPTVYATAVGLRRASSLPDAEAYALAGLLALRLYQHDATDELLDQLNRAATAHLTERGLYMGYGDPRPTIFAAAFQHAAGRCGTARTTLRGIDPARTPSGALTGVLRSRAGEYEMSASFAAEVCRLPSFLNGVTHAAV